MTKIDETLRKITAGISKESLPASLKNDSEESASSATNLGDPACPICHGIGFYRLEVPITDPGFGKVEVCSCRQKEVVQNVHRKLFKFANLESLSRYTFDSFLPNGKPYTLSADQANNLESAYQRCINYANNLNGWLVIVADCGRGKTHLAAAIANQVVSLGVPTLFLTVPDLLDGLRYTFNDPTLTFEDRFEEIRSVGLLVMDDFGTENATPWAKEKLFQILNYRYIHRLPVVITTNQKLEEIEERIQSRLRDRELVEHIHIDVPDFRNPASAGNPIELTTLHLHQSETFDSFQVDYGANNAQADKDYLKKVIVVAHTYAELPKGWLVFLGESGTGKTHLASAIGNYAAAHGRPVEFISVPDLLDHLRSTFHPDSKVPFDKMFNDIKNSPLLILDDLGSQAASPWAKEKLMQLFNSRYYAKLPTVITSSLPIENMDPHLLTRFRDQKFCSIIHLGKAVKAGNYSPSERKPRPKKSRESMDY